MMLAVSSAAVMYLLLHDMALPIRLVHHQVGASVSLPTRLVLLCAPTRHGTAHELLPCACSYVTWHCLSGWYTIRLVLVRCP